MNPTSPESPIDNSFGIVPKPWSLCRRPGDPFLITGTTAIVCVDERSRPSADYLKACIERSAGLTLPLQQSGQSNAIILKSSSNQLEFEEEDAYHLEANHDVVAVTGKSPSGLFCGVQTFLQLLPSGIYSGVLNPDLDLRVAPVTILDRPFMGRIRGLHIDIARHFRTKDELMTIIDCMAMHKLNTLHLHLTDDEGWRIEIKSYPRLTGIGATGCTSDPNAPAAFLSQDEVREVCAHAKKHYISIIPEIDMPGHMGAAIRAYPELRNERDARKPARVIQGSDTATKFAKAVLTEVNELFDPDCIHVGFDEVNYGAETELFTDEQLVCFAKTICTFIQADLKKTPIVWDDVFVKGWHDKDTIVQWWRYGLVHWWKDMECPADEALNRAKQPCVLSPAYWTYFDMPQEGCGGWAGSISTAEVYNWNPLEDMAGGTRESPNLIQGAIACTWSDNMPTMKEFCKLTLPRLAAFCERVWCGGMSGGTNALSWPDYRDRVLIPFQLKRYDALGLHYWGKDEPELLSNLNDAKKNLQLKSGQNVARRRGNSLA